MQGAILRPIFGDFTLLSSFDEVLSRPTHLISLKGHLTLMISLNNDLQRFEFNDAIAEIQAIFRNRIRVPI